MKRNIIIKSFILTVIGVLIFALFGCSLSGPSALVRFQNSSTDYEVYHGLKFGDAEVLFTGSDTFSPGEITAYASTAPGSYSVQGLDAQGNWQTMFAGTGTVETGGEYTVVIEGSFNSGTLYAYLVTDSAP